MGVQNPSLCGILNLPYMTTKALIVQSDRTLLLDVHCETAEAARQVIMPFAELEKSPDP